MNETISIKVKDNKTGEVVLEEDYTDIEKYRMVFFKDGFVDTRGNLSWKMMKAPVKEWAQAWAETHAGEFETLVRQIRSETTDEEIISLLEYMKKEATALLPTNGKRNTVFASRIQQVILKAVIMTVRKVADKTKTIWEFPQSMTNKTDSNSLLGWLFRRR